MLVVSLHNMNNRRALLVRLVEMERPLQPILTELGKFGWDSEELIEVTGSHIINVLQSYVEGRATADEVEEWGNALECRDDLKVSGNIKEAIHILANPYLTVPLSRQVAFELIDRLSNEKTS